MPRKPLKVGDTVRLRKNTETGGVSPEGTAEIALLYRDIEGGVRLNHTVAGFFSWNEKDLALVRRASRA